MPTRRLRQLLQKPGIIRSLGAHDVFTARLIEAAGLETVFIGGFGTSASLLGLPDVGFLTLTEMADAVRRMAQRVAIPVVADGDTGHGDLHNVERTVREFERAGAAGLLIEDPQSRAELERIPREVRYPLLVNMLTGGVTPILPVEELQRLGYKIIVCPIESLLVFGTAMRKLIDALLTRGRCDLPPSEMMTFAEVKKLL